ncbi:MAG: hypothetical protein JHC74_15045, partial [Thermoleophilia bacterium]|nr:hypothetical protein [Thermoleophilia bacterium]
RSIGRRGGLVLAAGAALRAVVPTAAAVPTISGADTDVWNAANPDPTYTITASSSRLRVYWQVPGTAFSDGRSPLRVRLGDLQDGTYRLIAREGIIFNPATVQRSFRVDTTAPAVTLTRPSEGSGGEDDDDDDDDRRIDRFTQGSAVTADYSCDGAVTCAGPVPPGGAIDTSRTGTFAFPVRAVDDAGNETVREGRYEVVAGAGTVLSPPVATTPVVVTPPAVTRVSRPRTLHARRLLPRAGARVGTRRPLLRWRAHSSAQLYNVQVFRLRGVKATKVLSAFPRSTRFRVPAKKIAAGDRYVWRVWPYLAKGYPDRPLGLSYFDVRRK